MPTVMITGANRGLGVEFARQYGADGWTVIATCRNPIDVGELATIDGDIQVHGLDVTDGAQVDRLAGELDGTAIDVLINNAGIYGPREYAPGDADQAAWHQVMQTNVMAPLKVAAAFTPHVVAGDLKIMATVSSKMGSMGENTSGGSYIYRSSKAAVNAVMRSLSYEVEGQGITVFVLHPGWVQTDMGGPSAAIDAVTSVTGMRGVIDGAGPDANGRFFNYDGAELPW